MAKELGQQSLYLVFYPEGEWILSTASGQGERVQIERGAWGVAWQAFTMIQVIKRQLVQQKSPGVKVHRKEKKRSKES